MCQTQCPQSKVRRSVGYASEHKFNWLYQLMDEYCSQTKIRTARTFSTMSLLNSLGFHYFEKELFIRIATTCTLEIYILARFNTSTVLIWALRTGLLSCKIWRLQNRYLFVIVWSLEVSHFELAWSIISGAAHWLWNFLQFKITSILMFLLCQPLMPLLQYQRLHKQNPRRRHQNDKQHELVPVHLIVDDVELIFILMVAKIQKELYHFADNTRC